MLESLLLTQGKIVPPPMKGDITFKTSGTSATSITTSELGSGFTTQYSIDGADFVTAGTTFSIPAGEHEVTLKLDVTTGTALNLAPFKGVLTEVIDWEGFQLSNIQFNNCTKLIKVPDYLPVAITNMTYMFYGCTSFNSDIGQWDTSKVTSMIAMFYGCSSFNQDISNWDVSKVTDMKFMFTGCKSFNQDLSSMVFKSSVNRTDYDFGCTAWNSAYRPKFTG